MRNVPLASTILAVSLLLAPRAQAAGPAWVQPAYERAAQKSLPQSKAPLWLVLAKTRIGEDDRRGLFTAAFPQEVKALNGRTVTLSGFMLPLDATDQSHHFLLLRYTPVCFFCPPGAPNEVVEVVTRNGVEITDRMLTVTGRLTLANGADKGFFFQMDQAVAR